MAGLHFCLARIASAFLCAAPFGPIAIASTAAARAGLDDPRAAPPSPGAPDAEGLEGFDVVEDAPKPTPSKPSRFDPKAFFAAWGTGNAEFDHDGSGVVDCPDLELAIRKAGGGRAATTSAIVLGKTNEKEGLLKPRGGQPSSLVRAWGTNAANFDFDGNGIVGCGDVPGLIANDLKPLAPGAKPRLAPPTDPGPSSDDPSIRRPDFPATGGTGSTANGSTGGSADARSAGNGRRSAPGGGGGGSGRGSGSAQGQGGGGDTGLSGLDAPPVDTDDTRGSGGASGGSSPPPPPPPGSTFNGGGGGGAVARGEVAIRYRAGTPGGADESEFTWVVTGVRESGTFIDGTPWITVAPGAQLVDLSPKSVRRRTSGGIEVWTSGSAKNPVARRYVDPMTLQDRRVAGGVFDGRFVQNKPPTQAVIDGDYDPHRNIGIVPPGNRTINPVPLVAGDVIVTADSEWIENDTRSWGASDGLAPHASPGRRTAIKRFGVLTVLRQAPTQPSFRPPFQWIPGDEANRPDPIPVARVRSDERDLLHNTERMRTDPDRLLSGPTFHDGHSQYYQSSHAIYAISTDTSVGPNLTYGGNLAKGVLAPALVQATNLAQPSVRRQQIRNRLIQYGIDCYGSVLSLVQSVAGAGQRASELKPWIILAGWWLENPSMRNPYQALRDRYPGTALAAATDDQIGFLFFHDDFVCRPVIQGIGEIQRWGTGQPHRVTSASLVTSSSLCGIRPVTGRFGRLTVSGVPLAGDIHARKPLNFYGRYLKIESGAGAGPTLYKVLRVGGDRTFSDWVEVDRPWAHGMPDATSSFCIFPFRNGDAVPGDVADLGRWYFSREGQHRSVVSDDLSPLNDAYAKTSADAFMVPYAALKRLADRTGNRDFVRGTTWNWLSEVVGGTGTTPGGQRFGAAPDSDRIQNLFWDDPGYLGQNFMNVVKPWLGVTGQPGTYGQKDLSRIPGTQY